MAEQTDAAEFTTLQSLMWPEAGVCTERDLFVRVHGKAGPAEAGGLRFFEDSRAEFNTWFNLFNAGTWQRHCGLQSLYLLLQGRGRFAVTVILARPEHSWDRLDRIVELDDGPVRLDLGALLPPPGGKGVMFFELQAIGTEAELADAAWQTADAPRRQPQLALAVTTFKREAAVARTAERFCAFRETSWMKDRVELIITDNGQSVELPPRDGVTVIANENLGGAGGFTRGLLEARARGASHCLFMDDDASIHMQSLERTWMLLAFAEDAATAVAGAMISEQHRWAVWENGARFFTRCQPQHMGCDLRDFWQMADMEWEVSGAAPEGLYGGWWYFAFPVAQAEHLAFPFFVRGDDVSFSMVNRFNIVRLNGVVSYQESFTDKESPQTWYLDLRSHMAHHLSLPQLEVGARGVLKIALWFFQRNLPRMHYDTLAAINLAVEDVMQGPEFFDRNADMAQRRAEIKALTGAEAWQELTPETSLPPVRHHPPAAWRRHLMKLSLNGLLLPGFARFGRKITLEAQNRGHLGHVWGAAEITCLNAERTKFYTVRHSKSAAWRELKRFAANARAFLKAYDQLAAAYRSRYGSLTSEAYWQDKLGLGAGQARPAAEAERPAAE
ncbi:glycosyltransferase [Cribrihabitans pelagius]|uniref:glycosyltransferase n=1 Tax=Cribrihabitans pelagius TaxID=1765746 RepID=UPI003B596D23